MADKWTKVDDKVLKKYPRAFAHMRRQLAEKRFGVVFGSGASKELGFPDWGQFIKRLVDHKDVQAGDLESLVTARSLTFAAEMLYQHFQRREWDYDTDPKHNDMMIRARWRRILHECLYAQVSEDIDELLRKGSIYRRFLPLVKQSPLTVNYNFDDTLERFLLHERSPDEKKTARGFETVVDGRLPFRTTNVIYHPNGFLPSNHLEDLGGPIILSEPSFADQTMAVLTGEYSTLLHHISKNTLLLVGLSLSDEPLRHLLRRNALLNPGHVHYWIKHKERANDPEPTDVIAANFETYNLVTLYLTSKEISALAKCLDAKPADLADHGEEIGVSLCYTYYITGVPGVGKTTSFSYFRSLIAVDEWLDQRNPLMSKAHQSLSEEERRQVDEWVRAQVALKNNQLRRDEEENKLGIRVVDRCPLDALAFGEAKERQTKASQLLKRIAPGQAKQRKIQAGQVILLTGHPEQLLLRSESRNRQEGTNVERITKLQSDTKDVYSTTGMSHLHSHDMTISEVVRWIARRIFLEDYEPFDLHGRLLHYAEDKK